MCTYEFIVVCTRGALFQQALKSYAETHTHTHVDMICLVIPYALRFVNSKKSEKLFTFALNKESCIYVCNNVSSVVSSMNNCAHILSHIHIIYIQILFKNKVCFSR